MDTVFSFAILGVLVILGSVAVTRARRLLDDDDSRLSDLSEFRAMEDRGEFSREEARRLHVALQSRFIR